MNFNTDLQLWDAEMHCRTTGEIPNTPIVVTDGHFVCAGRGVIARFTDDAQAVETLKKAGFTNNGEGWVK
jgi:hypothetical protein